MRILGLAAIAITVSFSLPSPAQAERVCVPNGDCYTAECWEIPDGRRCRRVCPRRCFDDTPRYVPPRIPDPETASRYIAPQPSYRPFPDHPPFDDRPFRAFLVIGAILFLAFLLTQSTSIDTAIAKAEKSAASARTLAREASSKVDEIDALISDAERDAFESGRKAADKEWKEWTRE